MTVSEPTPHLPSADLKARVLGAAKQTPSPTRRSQITVAWILVSVAVLTAVAVWLWMGGIRVTHRPTALIVGTSVGTGLVAAVSAWAAFGRSKSMMGRPTSWLITIALGGPLALLAWKI